MLQNVLWLLRFGLPPQALPGLLGFFLGSLGKRIFSKAVDEVRVGRDRRRVAECQRGSIAYEMGIESGWMGGWCRCVVRNGEWEKALGAQVGVQSLPTYARGDEMGNALL